jgi:hypothetical protein
MFGTFIDVFAIDVGNYHQNVNDILTVFLQVFAKRCPDGSQITDTTDRSMGVVPIIPLDNVLHSALCQMVLNRIVGLNSGALCASP